MPTSDSFSNTAFHSSLVNAVLEFFLNHWTMALASIKRSSFSKEAEAKNASSSELTTLQVML